MSNARLGETQDRFDFVTGEWLGVIDQRGREIDVPSWNADGTLRTPTGGSVDVGGSSPMSIFQPYKFAGFGDSRIDTFTNTPELGTTSAIYAPSITPPLWTCALLGDAVLTRSYGIGGDTAANWSNASRANGRTVYDLCKADIDAVIIQYGINDARVFTSAATIAGYLQGLCSELMKAGKLVFFESMMTLDSTYASAAAIKAIADATNVLMVAWLAQFPKQAAYININPAVSDASGWLRTDMSDGSLHLNQKGALAVARVEAAAIRELLPQLDGVFPGPDNRFPNLLNLVTPSSFIDIDTGTAPGATKTSGLDSIGYFTEFNWTPTSNPCTARFTLGVNFATGTLPFQTILGNEYLQGSARVILDDGNGGAPNALMIQARQKVWSSIQADWGDILKVTGNDLGTAIDMRLITPRMATLLQVGTAAATSVNGYNLAFNITSQTIGVPVRLRVYKAQLRVVGYHTTVLTAASFALPATTVAYTNASYGKQRVTVGGGVVTAIAINGVTTGLIDGVFVLNPGDTLTPTYSSAPTWTVTQIN